MAGVRITIRPAGMNALLRSPTGDLGRWLHGELVAVEVGAKQRCPTDTYDLRTSSEVEVKASSSSLHGEVRFTAPYAIYAHNGSRPHWPPIAALAGWAQRHGIPSPYLVARAIALRGTKGTPFLLDAAKARFSRTRARAA